MPLNPLNTIHNDAGYNYALGSVLQHYQQPTIYGSVTGLGYSGSDTRVGYSNPSYKQQIRNGVNATTSFLGQKYTQNVSYFTAHGTATQQDGTPFIDQEAFGYIQYPIMPTDMTNYGINLSPALVTNVTNRCLRKFTSEATAALTSSNITGRSIRHFKHDMHNLIHPMTSLRDKISSYLSKLEKSLPGSRTPKTWLNVLRTEYLAYKFGTQPFVEDITAILVDAAHERFPQVPIRASARGTDSATSGSFTLNSLNSVGFTVLNIKSSYLVKYNYGVSMKGAIRTESGTDGKIGFLQSQQLLPRNWLPTAFSILPYAWMIDYFTNIGDIIDGICFPFSNLTWGSVTTKVEQVITYGDTQVDYSNLPLPTPPFVYGIMECNGGNATFNSSFVTRNILTPAFLIPQIEISLPTSLTKLTNLVAVFQPRISKLLSTFPAGK